MRRSRRWVVALVAALLVALAPSLTGGHAAVAEPSPASDDDVLLVPPGTQPRDEELDELAEKVIRNPMGQELYLAIKKFNQLRIPPANTSVAFFSFSWMAQSSDLPEWLTDNYEYFLGNLSHETRSPSSAPRWKYPLSVEMLPSDDLFLDGLFEQLDVRAVDGYGKDHVLEIATGSMGDNRHSEDAMDEWMSRSLKDALLPIARTASQRAEIAQAVKTIKSKSAAGIAGPRTFCNICEKTVEAAGYDFPKKYFVVEFDKRGSPQAKIANQTVNKLLKKMPSAYEVWLKDAPDELMQKLGMAVPCETGTNTSSMNLAARPLAAPCGGSSLAGALASQTYGGVDFSSLQLRYLSDVPGSGVKYAFSAQAAEKGLAQDSRSGRAALINSMADLRTWLALDPDKFWVNLNPDEPDRIIDSQLGRTNAGRALLEADWQMKQTEGKLLDPKTSFGRKYWEKLGSSAGEICYSSRMWIVPGEVQVHQEGSSLYVLKADLDVKAKAEKVASLGQTNCNADPAETARNEQLEQEMVVPKIVKAVNTDPEYASLRQAFLARVVAQWIRDRHDSGHTTSFDKLINSGDLGPATTTGTWKPQQVYDRYLRSIKEGDFTYKQTTRVGDTTITYVMTTGGVDFSKLNTDKLSATDMDREVPGLPQVVQKSVAQPMTASDGSVWLGDKAEAPPVSTGDRISSFLSGRTGILVVLLVALGVLLFFIRDGSALRRRPSG